MSKFIPLLLLTLLITSCGEKKIIYVAPTLADCQGESSQKCLQLKENKEDEWTLFYDQIEGFDYKEGFTYKLEVAISKVENPPADTSSLKYKLVKLIYQEPAAIKTEVAQTLSGKWKVTNMIGMDSLATQPTLTLKDGQISGNAGCNSYSANYTVEDNKISIGLAMATKMYCTNMKVEKAFFECLQKAKSYTIKDGSLMIYDDTNKELLVCGVDSE